MADSSEQDTERDVMTVEQAAAFLQVSRQQLYKLLKEGRLTGARVGKRLRFTRRQLLDFVDGGGVRQK